MSADWVAIIIVSVPAALAIFALFRPERCPSTISGGHSWDYGNRGISGWGVVRCSVCGKEDIY